MAKGDFTSGSAGGRGKRPIGRVREGDSNTGREGVGTESLDTLACPPACLPACLPCAWTRVRAHLISVCLLGWVCARPLFAPTCLPARVPYCPPACIRLHKRTCSSCPLTHHRAHAPPPVSASVPGLQGHNSLPAAFTLEGNTRLRHNDTVRALCGSEARSSLWYLVRRRPARDYCEESGGVACFGFLAGQRRGVENKPGMCDKKN